MAFAAVQKAEHPVAPAAAAEGAPRGDGNHILQASEFPLLAAIQEPNRSHLAPGAPRKRSLVSATSGDLSENVKNVFRESKLGLSQAKVSI